MANEITGIQVNNTTYNIKDISARTSITYLSNVIDHRPGNVVISANSTSSMGSAIVNFVTIEEYRDLSNAGELLSTQFYAVDQNPFDGDSAVTIQYYDDNGVLSTVQDDLSIIELSSQEEFEKKAFDGELAYNAIYKISSDTVNFYGKRAVNAAEPEDLSDLVNLSYFNKNVPQYEMIDVYPSIKSSSSYRYFYATNHCIHNVKGTGNMASLSIYMPSYTGKSRDFYLLFKDSGTPTLTLVPTDGSTLSVHNTTMPNVSLTSNTYYNYIHVYEMFKDNIAVTVTRLT